DIVKTLLRAGANIWTQQENYYTPLMSAAQQGHISVMEVLLEHVDAPHRRSYLEIKSSRGDSALNIAASNGKAEVIPVLLNAGADIQVRDKDGYTPLMRAAQQGHSSVVEVLLGHVGAWNRTSYLEMKDKCGESALCIAASNGKADVIPMLL